MRNYKNYRVSKSGRLIIASLFSLVLHASLILFVRFVQPASSSLASESAPLTVTLENIPAETAQPTGIPQASQEAAGEEKIGVQEKNITAKGTVATPEPVTGDHFSTEAPRGFITEKILALDKPQSFQVSKPVASVPDLLVTKKVTPVAPELHEEKKESFAPAPSVAKPVTTAPPPLEKLVSSEPLQGERHEKIILVEPTPEKPATDKPVPETPVKVAETRQVKTEEIKPFKTEGPKLAQAEEIKPAKVEQQKQARAEEVKPAPHEESTVEKSEMASTPRLQSAEGGKSEAPPTKSPGVEIASQSLLNIPLIKKIEQEADKRPPSAERRKSISFKERDFSYAMYVEGLRLKLERIGSLNYPAASAGGSLSGALSVKISIRADGSLEDVSIIRSSGLAELDAGAEKIVRMSAPFSPLPADIRKDADVLSVTIPWRFSGSRQLFD